MTTAGTRAVVNTGKGKMYTDLKKSRWVWRPKGNYMDHESKESGSFMLKKFEAIQISSYRSCMVFSGYSTTSKAFRVYNKRTKRVEENLHIDFLEDQPNVAGTGPNWMFDLDFLTNSMNYIPVSVENQVNVDAGTQDSYVAGSSGKDKEPTQEYILLPLHPHRTRIPVEDVAPAAHEKPSESSPKDNDVQDSEDVADKEGQHQMTKEKNATTPYVSTASTPTGANAGESSFVYLRGKIPIDASTLPNADLPINLNMPDLEDDSDAFLNDGIFNGAYDDENKLVILQCKKPDYLANSTTEAEMMQLLTVSGQILWIQNQMMDYGFNFMNTRIHIDNESTISVIKNPVAHSRTKHIEIQFHFIRDCYEKRLIEVIKIRTDSNVADLLTKGFDVTRFNFLVVLDNKCLRWYLVVRAEDVCDGVWVAVEMMAVGGVDVAMVVAAGDDGDGAWGAWFSGSGRSSGEKQFWTWPKKVAEDGGSWVVAGDGHRKTFSTVAAGKREREEERIMSSVTAQQTKLDLELVPKENRLDIRKCNGRIPRGFDTQVEPTFPVVLDAFKLDKKKRFKLTLEVFRDIFQICSRVQGRDIDPSSYKEEHCVFLENSVLTRRINSLYVACPQIPLGCVLSEECSYVELLWEDFILPIDYVATKARKEMKEVRKKILRDFHMTHPSSSGTVSKNPPRVEKITPTVTSVIGTGDKPGVPDVTKDDSTESGSESWGNDDDDNNNEQE
ncbi:hypothetical protein Tco_1419145 [Tanacetum coccineum]